jgi:hypothetical protein
MFIGVVKLKLENFLNIERIYMAILTKIFLKKHYIELGKSLREISNETGIKSITIGRALNKFNIPKRTCGTRKGKPNKGIMIKKDDIIIGYRYGMLVVKK